MENCGIRDSEDFFEELSGIIKSGEILGTVSIDGDIGG